MVKIIKLHKIEIFYLYYKNYYFGIIIDLVVLLEMADTFENNISDALEYELNQSLKEEILDNEIKPEAEAEADLMCFRLLSELMMQNAQILNGIVNDWKNVQKTVPNIVPNIDEIDIDWLIQLGEQGSYEPKPEESNTTWVSSLRSRLPGIPSMSSLPSLPSLPSLSKFSLFTKTKTANSDYNCL